MTFISTFTTAVDNSTICTNRLLFLMEFCPFLVLLCKNEKAVLSQGAPRYTAVNFDTYRILQ